MMQEPIPIVIVTIIGCMTFGSRCLNIIERLLQLIDWAASIYSLDRSDRIWPRIIRTVPGTPPTVRASTVAKNPEPIALETRIQSMVPGSADHTSISLIITVSVMPPKYPPIDPMMTPTAAPNKEANNKLPQTGNQDSTAIIGLGLVTAFASLFGFGKRKSEK